MKNMLNDIIKKILTEAEIIEFLNNSQDFNLDKLY